MTHETVGKRLYDKLVKEKPESVPVTELAAAMQENYMNELLKCVDDNYQKFTDSFYIEVLMKRETSLGTAFRNYFIPRATCPTPMHDQDVYRYNKTKGEVEYLWSVPCKDACIYLMKNARDVQDSEKLLLSFVLSFMDGTLLKACKKLNGEVLEAGISLL